MNKMLTVILFMGAFFIQQSHSAELIIPVNSSSCLTSDSENRHWLKISTYGLTAMNKSFDACKKESNFPTTCRVVKESCDLYIKEAAQETTWQCTALDFYGNPWRSTGSSKQDVTALAAKAKCRRNSLVPDSCYINLVTCRKAILSE
ncbi:MAG: hypothetical protein H0U73_08205 [Tatlockia sp.]|nr:hypothetical protein [Tatlockia sp.]